MSNETKNNKYLIFNPFITTTDNPTGIIISGNDIKEAGSNAWCEISKFYVNHMDDMNFTIKNMSTNEITSFNVKEDVPVSMSRNTTDFKCKHIKSDNIDASHVKEFENNISNYISELQNKEHYGGKPKHNLKDDSDLSPSESSNVEHHGGSKFLPAPGMSLINNGKTPATSGKQNDDSDSSSESDIMYSDESTNRFLEYQTGGKSKKKSKDDSSSSSSSSSASSSSSSSSTSESDKYVKARKHKFDKPKILTYYYDPKIYKIVKTVTVPIINPSYIITYPIYTYSPSKIVYFF